MGLNRVAMTTMPVTDGGFNPNDVAKMIVNTAGGILVSIIEVERLSPVSPINEAMATPTNGPITKRNVIAGMVSRQSVTPRMLAICAPKTSSMTGIAPCPAISMPRMMGVGMDMFKV